MWSRTVLTTTTIWDDLLWWVTAVWQDDADSDPVTMVKSGRTPLGSAEHPHELIAAALRALERETVDHVPQQRNS